MEIELIIQSIMGLVGILALLIFFLFITPNKDDFQDEVEAVEIIEKEPVITMDTDMESLRDVIKNKGSITEELRTALELIIKYHGTVHTKLGIRAHPDFDIYEEVLFRICRHPNADKDMIINFDSSLSRLNPEYKEDINEAMTKGLTSRRV
ncbi:hypothetical protein N9A28_07070 [Sulfurimonas sp.]|nr:hypothetical protein [Sulfurimonas sp.]